MLFFDLYCVAGVTALGALVWCVVKLPRPEPDEWPRVGPDGYPLPQPACYDWEVHGL